MLSLTLVGDGPRGADIRAGASPTPGQTSFSIGRDPACDWVLPDRTLAVSARHCEIVLAAGSAVLRDLSTNGTFVNGAASRMPADHALRDGDRFDVGPYTIAVALAAQPAGSAGFVATAPLTARERPASKPPAAGRSPAVDDTAPLSIRPLRGRDPAAAAASRLPPEDADLTRIRPAPAAGARPPGGAPPAPSPAAAVVEARPRPVPISPLSSSSASAVPSAPGPRHDQAAARSADDDALRARLAQALGLPAPALAGQDPAQLLDRLCALARASVDGLRQLLAAQAATQREIGSRRPVDWRSGATLRLAGGTDEALLALLEADAAAAMASAVRTLIDHQARLVSAPRAALRRLGDDLSPDHLASALPVTDPARQWAVYARLWQHLGLAADDAAWSAGFAAAGWLHLAAAYDQDGESPPA